MGARAASWSRHGRLHLAIRAVALGGGSAPKSMAPHGWNRARVPARLHLAVGAAAPGGGSAAESLALYALGELLPGHLHNAAGATAAIPISWL